MGNRTSHTGGRRPRPSPPVAGGAGGGGAGAPGPAGAVAPPPPPPAFSAAGQGYAYQSYQRYVRTGGGGGGEVDDHHDERTYGPAPPAPLFPWQFFADANAAKLDQVRQQRRQEAAAKRREKALAMRNGSGANSSEDEPSESVSKASVAPEDGTCCFDMIPREILLYILQDVGEETLATACPFVNRQFYEASLDDQLWRHLFLVDIGRAPPPFNPSHKYSNGKWHRQPATEKEEYFYKIWKWYESYGRSVRDVREERFTELTKGWMEVSPFANSRMALLSEITTFDQRKLRPVVINDRSAPVLRPHRNDTPINPHHDTLINRRRFFGSSSDESSDDDSWS